LWARYLASQGNFALTHKTYYAIAAGFVGGAVASPLLLLMQVRTGLHSMPTLALMIGTTIGLLVPGALSSVAGIMSRQPKRLWVDGRRAAVIGAVVMTSVSLVLAQLVDRDAVSFDDFVPGLLVWILFGCVLGAVEGIVWRSRQRALLGALGGSLGSLVAYLLGYLLDNTAVFLLVGPLIGLGSILLPDALRAAWVDINNDECQYTVSLDKAAIIFGSSDNPDVADVGIYGDRNIAARHFTIEQRASEYVVSLVSAASPVYVNGASVPPSAAVALAPGDRLTVGETSVVFHTREDS
jgi:hypothetical protein